MVSKLLQKHQHQQLFQESSSEIKFATSKHHRINAMLSVHPENEKPTTIVRPLVNSTADQFLTDQVPAAVQDLFQMANVPDLLMIYQLLKSSPRDLDRVSKGVSLVAQYSQEYLYTRRPRCVLICRMARHHSDV